MRSYCVQFEKEGKNVIKMLWYLSRVLIVTLAIISLIINAAVFFAAMWQEVETHKIFLCANFSLSQLLIIKMTN